MFEHALPKALEVILDEILDVPSYQDMDRLQVPR